MRRHAESVLALALATFALPAHADEYSDFRVPEHRYLSSTGSLSARLNRELANSSEVRRTRLADGSGAADVSWSHDSDPRRTTLSAALQGSALGRWQRQTGQFGSPAPGGFFQDFVSANSDRFESATAYVQADHVRYPWSAPVGIGALVFASAGYGSSRQENSSTTQSFGPPVGQDVTYERSRRRGTSDSREVSAALTLSAGRVRDATGVYEAHVLERRLVDLGALSRDLSPTARRRLAELMTVRAAYDFVRDRPAKDLWGEVERIAREDGALSEAGIDPYAVWRGSESPTPGENWFAVDGLPRAPVSRRVGSELRVEVGGRHTHLSSEEVTHDYLQFVDDGVPGPPVRVDQTIEFDSGADEVFAGVAGAWHRPVSHTWQLDAAALARVPLHEDEDGVETVVQLVASWLVSERWLGLLRGTQQRFLRHDDVTRRDDRWFVQYGATLQYALTERIVASASLAESQQKFLNAYFRRTGLALGVGYRFAGRLESPGLTLPVLR